MTHKKSTLQRFMKDRRNLYEFPDRMQLSTLGLFDSDQKSYEQLVDQ